MLRTLLISLLISITTLTSTAQQAASSSPSATINVASGISGWPQNRWSLPHEVVVVTISRPGVRQKCKFPDLTADTLTCAASHHHSPTTYTREDIAALIHPRSHEERNIMLIPAVLMGALIASSFFVPLGWAITLRVFAFLSFCTFGAMGIGATGDDHNHDIVLYQRPNTPLTIHLRTH
jgi:hypothetical protein